jgi:signal transduction histidine kinase
MIDRPAHPVSRYLFAVFCTGLALVFALLLKSILAHGVLSLFLIAVIAASWVGGLGPGLLATALGVLATDFFFLAPTYSLAVQSADDVAEIGVFSFVALVINLLQRAQEKTQRALEALNEKLEDRVEERTSWLTLVHDITGTANESETVDQAFRFALRQITTRSLWRFSRIYTPAPGDPSLLLPAHVHSAAEDPRLLKLQDASSELRVSKGNGPVGRVAASGVLEWIVPVALETAYQEQRLTEAGLQTAIVFPIVADRKVVAVVECFSENRLDRDRPLTDLMTAVGTELGLVVERKQLQEGYSEAVWQQQRLTAQELHDGLGQSLTGLLLMGTSLRESLQGTDHAVLTGKLADGIEQALGQIRNLAKGVFPVDPDAEGLMAALKQLVQSVSSASKIACRFECPDPVLFEDHRIALHLYRIAQEAMTNAIKHGRPKEVLVELRSIERGVLLTVTDDGIGIPAPGDRKEGSGLRIMKYRAAAIDAILNVERNGARGTLVSCLSPKAPKG